MRKILTLAVIGAMATGLAGAPAMAKPGGCLKYGAAGAVGGHMVHHGVLGAVGGCATGMWRRHEYNKQQRAEARAERMQEQNNAQIGNGYNGGYNNGYNNGYNR